MSAFASELRPPLPLTDGPAVRVVNLTCHYGVHPVLRDVSLEIARGELLAIMGPNGTGKSTLLGAIAGVIPPWRGFVEVAGLRRRADPETELEARRRCAFLPAEEWIAPGFTAREWIVTCGRIWGVEDRRLMDHASRLLALFDLGDGRQSISAASTGQRKKIALAGALATDAPVLLLDEPFAGGLDPSGILALKRVLKELARRRDRTIIMATPVPELVEDLADRVAILGSQTLAVLDTPAELRRRSGAASLEEAYERLVNPASLVQIENYLEAERAELAGRPPGGTS